MTDMVERVARAIDAAEVKWKSENGGDDASCLDCPDDVKARAAIEAMREPSPAMFQAGSHEVFVENISDAREIWQAMIDAALSEGQTREAGR